MLFDNELIYDEVQEKIFHDKANVHHLNEKLGECANILNYKLYNQIKLVKTYFQSFWLI